MAGPYIQRLIDQAMANAAKSTEELFLASGEAYSNALPVFATQIGGAFGALFQGDLGTFLQLLVSSPVLVVGGVFLFI